MRGNLHTLLNNSHIEAWERDPMPAILRPKISRHLDTSAHGGTLQTDGNQKPESIVISGDTADKKKFMKRASKKFYSDNLTFKLLRYSEGLEDPQDPD